MKKKLIPAVVAALAVLVGMSLRFIFPPLSHFDDYVVNKLHLSHWDWLAFIVALLSLLWSIMTWLSQYQTEKNTMKITPTTQRKLLVDYIRHLYRNEVVIRSLSYMMEEKYDSHYPSEEHLLKLKMPLEALHPEIFTQNSEQYDRVHNLLLLVRNYNTEVEVALTHLCDKRVPREVKIRDMQTLTFKTSYISGRIYDVIQGIWPRVAARERQNIRGILLDTAYSHSRVIANEAREEMSRRREADGQQVGGRLTRRRCAQEAAEFRNYQALLTLGPRRPDYGASKPSTPEEYTDVVRLFFSDDPELYYALLRANINVEINELNGQGSHKLFLIPFGK